MRPPAQRGFPLERTSRRWALALAILTLLATPATAHSRTVRVYHSPLYRALQVALEKAHELWGVEPCGGHYRIELVAHLEGEAGHAFFDEPLVPNEWPQDAELYVTPPSTWTSCVLALRGEDWLGGSLTVNWPMICTIVMHEYGHLTGHVHSDEPQFSNAPGVPPDTPEQAAVMRSGSGDTAPDLARCGWQTER